MKIYTKDLEHLGFEGSGIFQSNWHHFYYAKSPKSRKIFIIDNLEHSVWHFELSKKEYSDFNSGKLSLVPNGCCCATGNKCKDDPINDFSGDFKKIFKVKKNFIKFVGDLVNES